MECESFDYRNTHCHGLEIFHNAGVRMSNKIKPQNGLFNKLTLISLSILAAAWLIVWIITIAKNLTGPQMDYSEGFNMWNAHLFGTGQWQWNALQGPPFNAIFYTPIWYVIMGKVTNIFGDSLITGRISNLVFFSGILILIFLLVWH